MTCWSNKSSHSSKISPPVLLYSLHALQFGSLHVFSMALVVYIMSMCVFVLEFNMVLIGAATEGCPRLQHMEQHVWVSMIVCKKI